MSASTYDATGETGTVTPDRRAISERAIAEVEALHDEVLATKPARRWSSLASRRRYRDACVAETDLLRVLGFESWQAFDALVARERDAQPESGPIVDLAAVEATELTSPSKRRGLDDEQLDLTDIADLVRMVLHELADSRADLEALQASTARVDELLDRALMEIVALRLELVVMATRARERLS